MLLDHLEHAVKGIIIEEDSNSNLVKTNIFDSIDKKTCQLLKVYIKLGWKKLNKYYSLLTPTAYMATVVFHPCKKWHRLELLWDCLPSQQTAK